LLSPHRLSPEADLAGAWEECTVAAWAAWEGQCRSAQWAEECAFSAASPQFNGARFANARFANAAISPRFASSAFHHGFHHRFFHHRFNRFAFFGGPFVYAAYDSCWSQVWTAYGPQWVNVCANYGY
jgi:hypothetical protein